MKVCPKCNQQNTEQAQFCVSCGTDMTGKATGHDHGADLKLLKEHLEPKDVIAESKLEDGEGGFAEVYLGSQPGMRSRVAIKFLKAHWAHDPQIRERFLREARTAANLRHRNIVDVFLVGMIGERPYFVMEFADGGSLKSMLRKEGRLPVAKATDIMAQVLDGLGTAHKRGVVHRDIKPDNILLRDDGEPFVTDFGIAHAAEGTSITQTGTAMGTADFMAPEQFQGLSETDGRSDIYSAGIMYFQLLTGSLPFEANSSAALGYKHVHEPLPDITERADMKNLPPKIQEVLERACAKNPDERYATAEEFARDLRSLDLTDVGSAPASVSKTVPTSARTTVMQTAPATSAPAKTAVMQSDRPVASESGARTEVIDRSGAPQKKSSATRILLILLGAFVLMGGGAWAALFFFGDMAQQTLEESEPEPPRFEATPVPIQAVTINKEDFDTFVAVPFDDGIAELPAGSYDIRFEPPQGLGLRHIRLLATVSPDEIELMRSDGKVAVPERLVFQCDGGLWDAQQGRCIIRSTPPTPVIAGNIVWGDDTGKHARDGECDDPRFVGTGAPFAIEESRLKDASDCKNQFNLGQVTLKEQGDRSPAPPDITPPDIPRPDF